MLVPLFPSPGIHHECHGMKPELLQWVKSYHQTGEHDGNSSSCGWHSKYDLHEDKDFLLHFLWIHAQITHAILEITPARIEIASMWANINGPTEFNMSHLHAGVDFSGCLWLQTPENCGVLTFENDNAITRYNWKVPEDIKEKYHLHDTTWFNPQAGSLLIFPADLRHRVERNCSDEDRISIGLKLKCS